MAFGATWAIPPLRDQSRGALALTAVVLSALYAGLGPGLFATAISVVIINTYFAPPHPYQVLPTAVADIVRLTVFAMVAVLISSLSDQRRRAEKKLRQREQYFRLLIENTSDIVTILGADGVVRYQSPSLERDLGYAPNELVGQNVFQFVSPEDLSRVGAKFESGVKKPGATSPPVELRFRAKDGSWRTLECVGKNMLDEPWVAGIVIHSRDITARKRVEIKAPGKLFGNVTTPCLIIQEGVIFEGHCSMGGADAAKSKVTPFSKDDRPTDGLIPKAVHSEAAIIK